MTDIVKYWNEEARKRLVGRTVTKVRYLKPEEMRALGWNEAVLVIEFDDGTMIFPSMDDEGNGGGALFGQGPGPQNEELVFPVIRSYLLVEDPGPPASPLPEPSGRDGAHDGGREEATKVKLLKRLQRGESVHYLCEGTLRELEKDGFIASMERKNVPGKRVPYYFVTLSEKGKAA